jgi:tetratricopeptide (TPR) repeat protein
MPTLSRRRRAVPLLAAALAAAACRAAPPPLDLSHPLAMRPLAGAAAVPPATARGLTTLQAHVRQAPGSPGAWIALGEGWVRAARAAADPGLYHGADDAAAAALALAPRAPRALSLRGLVLMEGHRFTEAAALGAELTRLAPTFQPGYGLLSDALLELGRFDEAAAAAQRMLDLKPDLPAYSRAAYLLWLQGQVDAALEAARLGVDSGGDAESRAWVRAQAALMRWNRGEAAEAEAELALALVEAPDHPAALAARGRVALSRGRPADALAWLSRAYARSPLPETAWLAGDAAAGAGRGAEADAWYRRVVEGGRALDRRTLALFEATRRDAGAEAVRLAEAERAVRGDVYTEDVRAWALYRAGRLAEADAAAREACRLGTPDARLLFHAGAIRLARGDAAEGAELLRRALALNPAFDANGAAEARRLLATAGGRLARGTP